MCETEGQGIGCTVKSAAILCLSKLNVQLTISASGPPKSRNIMRTPSSDDIRRRSKGCLSRTLFLTPISSVNSVKPSSMCTPRVHSLPFQLQAGERTEVERKQRGCYKRCSATKASFISRDKQYSPPRENRTRLNPDVWNSCRCSDSEIFA